MLSHACECAGILTSLRSCSWAAGRDGVAFDLRGRLLSFLLTACNHFLDGTVSINFKVGVGSTAGSLWYASGRLCGGYMGGSAWSACSVGRFSITGKCMVGFGWGSSIVGRGLSGRVV